MTIRTSNQRRVIYITHKGQDATFINMTVKQAIKQFLHTYRGLEI